jgi:hypothetical protein
MAIDREDLINRFEYHPPINEEVKMRHESIRDTCFNLAEIIVELTPSSREQSLAITKLEEVMMWSNAAIARNVD